MREWLRIKDIPDYCGISERLAREWLKNGLRYSRIKGVVLIRRETLDSYIERFAVSQNLEDEIDRIADEVVREVTE